MERSTAGADRPARRREDDPVRDLEPQPSTSSERSPEHGALFDDAQASELRMRWDSIQTSFVDEPRESVAQADALVADVMQQLARTFSAERKALEKQWSVGQDISTEQLRQALRRYRSFFDRLLSL